MFCAPEVRQNGSEILDFEREVPKFSFFCQRSVSTGQNKKNTIVCFVTTNHARGSQLVSGAWNLVSDDELIAGSTYVCKIYTLCEMLASIVISLDGTGKALRRTIASFRTGTLHDIRHKVLLWKGSFGYMPIFFTCKKNACRRKEGNFDLIFSYQCKKGISP